MVLCPMALLLRWAMHLDLATQNTPIEVGEKIHLQARHRYANFKRAQRSNINC